MTGNTFLKYPPHKNVGDLPVAEYNLMRLQMEASKVPYMKRVLDNGILEVRKIYNNSYKAYWTPTGGNFILYVIRYKDSGGVARIKFVNNDLTEYADVLMPVSAIPATLDDIDSMEWKVNNDLVCVCYYEYNISEEPEYLHVQFYDTRDGKINAFDKSVGNMINNRAAKIFVQDEVVYLTDGTYNNQITVITPTKNEETGVYTFPESTVNTFSSHPKDYSQNVTRRGDEFIRFLSAPPIGNDFDGSYDVALIVDPVTGDETDADDRWYHTMEVGYGAVDGLPGSYYIRLQYGTDYWEELDGRVGNYFYVKFGTQEAIHHPFGSVPGYGVEGVGATYYEYNFEHTLDTVASGNRLNPFARLLYGYSQDLDDESVSFCRSPNGVFTVEGVKTTQIDFTDIVVDWRGFTPYKELFWAIPRKYQAVPSFPDYVWDDTDHYVPFIVWGVDSVDNEASEQFSSPTDLLDVFKLPHDITEITAMNCYPGIDKDPAIVAIIAAGG